MRRLFSLLLAFGLSLSLSVPSFALELEDAKELLKAHYIDPLPDGFEEMDDLDEILTAINDPYTTYLTAEEYSQLQTAINGQTVVGIGASVHLIYEDGYRILSVLDNSPALQAGLEAGDVILAVDGRTLTDTDDVTGFIRGQEGTEVTLTIRKVASGQVCDITITRRAVNVPIVTYELAGDALAIQCDSFGESTPRLVEQALRELEEKAAVCIVDLRQNPGGTIGSSAGAAGHFVGTGMASYVRGADGDYNHVFILPSCPDLTDKPVIVLTSNYSASGSEMFSGIIRDRGAGIGIGQRTFGKGVAQYVFNDTTHPELFDGDCLKITVYRFFSPNGVTNDTMGVIPTLVVSDLNAPTASLLLSSAKPKLPKGHLKLELAGHTFYIDLKEALQEEHKAAFTELLEAIPHHAVLYRGMTGAWSEITPEKLADRLGLPFRSRTFSDISTSPYADEINTLSVLKLLSGFEDGSFRPDEQITRGQFCAMVSAALNLNSDPQLAEKRFNDISAQSPEAGSIGAMADMGFVKGFEDGSFRPDNTITVQEMVTMLNQVAAWATMEGYDYAKMPLAGKAVTTYSSFAPWARISARNLELFDALLPDLQPTQTVKREEAAASLCRLMDGCGLLWR